MKTLRFTNEDASFLVDYVVDLPTNGEFFTVLMVEGLDAIEQTMGMTFQQIAYNLTEFRKFAVDHNLNLSIIDGNATQTSITGSVALGITTTTLPNGKTGVRQVERLTVVGTVSKTGDAKVTITSALLAEPIEFIVSVVEDDTADAVAGKVQTEIGTDASLTALFTIGGTSANVDLTSKIDRANDSTLNISIDNDTCEGLTPVPTSTNQTAGKLNLYNQSIVSAGGVFNYTYSITDGALPDGLEMNQYGNIKGYPTVIDDFTFDVTVTDGFQTDVQEITITVTADS